MRSLHKSIALTLLLVLARSRTSVQQFEDAAKGISFGIQVCTSKGNCRLEPAGMVLDHLWAGCPDPRNCTIIPTESDYNNVGISFQDGSQITLDFAPTGGSRAYLTTGPNSDEYRMFYMLNREFAFDVDVSEVGCGVNSCLFFSAMPQDGGKQKYGYAGARYGTGVCDGQRPTEFKPTCAEFDLWEANSHSTVFTTHSCISEDNCYDESCGLNQYSVGNKNFYGRGANYAVDTTRTFTVVTQFITDDGTDDGKLKEIKQFYVQNGRTITQPPFGPGYDSITDQYCDAYGWANNVTGVPGVSDHMGEDLKKGMVLISCLWGDANDNGNMFWLDWEPNGPCPDAYKNPRPRTSFGNIRVGPINSTT